MDNVWIVIGGHDYEGYSEPEGAFATQELAEEYKSWLEDREVNGYRYDYVDVLPLHLVTKAAWTTKE